MKPNRKVAVPVTALAVLAGGGGGYAYAAWPAPAPATLVLTTVSVPPGARPTAARDGTHLTVSWPPTTVEGSAAQRYLVTRHGAGTAVEVCAVPATTCTDDAPAGSWAYSIRPVFHGWPGEAGPQSDPVTVPAAARRAPAATVSPGRESGIPGGTAAPAGTVAPTNAAGSGTGSPGRVPAPAAPTPPPLDPAPEPPTVTPPSDETGDEGSDEPEPSLPDETPAEPAA